MIIAQRWSRVRHVDRVLLLERGQLVGADRTALLALPNGEDAV